MTWDYVAGFFDGEGSAGVYGAKGNTFKVTFHNTHRACLDCIREFLGCGRVAGRAGSAWGKKPMYVLAVNRVADLQRIIPLLVERCIIKVDALNSVLAHIQDKKSALNRGKVASIGAEVLSRWYTEDKLSINAIAKRIGVSPATVSRVLRNAGIVLRRKRVYQKELLSGVSPEELRRLYCDLKLSTVAIGRRIGVRHNAVFYSLKRHGIPIRSRSEAIRVRLAK